MKLQAPRADNALITVFIDDFLSETGMERGLLPVHGLGIHVTLKLEDGGERELIIDGGPLERVARRNMEALGIDVNRVDKAVLGLWSWHHVAAPLRMAREHVLPRDRLIIPPLPRHPSSLKELSDAPLTLAPTRSPIYNERVIIIKGTDWIASIIPCSVYGVEHALSSLASVIDREKLRLSALIGGFNISLLDSHGMRKLVKFAEKRGIELVVPLHSVSLEAREQVLKRLNVDLPLPGAGLRVEVA